MERSEYEWTYELEDTHWWFVSRRQLANALLEQQLTPGLNGFILDVGCGTGGNLDFLGRWGVTIGLDLNPLALNYARCRKLPRLAQASGLAFPYPNNTFSLVTCSTASRLAITDGRGFAWFMEHARRNLLRPATLHPG